MTHEKPFYMKPAWIASGVLLALVAITGAALAVTGGDGRATGATAPVRSDAWGSRCGLPHGSQDAVVGPPTATWTLVGHIAAPSVPGVGPGIIDGNDRRCYAHSPLGALLAAANFLPVTGQSTNRELGMDHYAPGPLRDVYARQPAIPVDPGTMIQTAGFTLTVVSRDAVDVTLALRADGLLGYVVLPMRWTEPGDWRLRLLSESEPVEAGRLDSLADYIPWSA
jgi:hypothetical protein